MPEKKRNNMKNIDCTKQLLALNGEVIKGPEGKDYMVGEALANLILSDKSSAFDQFKKYMVAKKFYTQKHVELDQPDFDKVFGIIKANADGNAVLVGQIWEYLSELSAKTELKAVE